MLMVTSYRGWFSNKTGVMLNISNHLTAGDGSQSSEQSSDLARQVYTVTAVFGLLYLLLILAVLALAFYIWRSVE